MLLSAGILSVLASAAGLAKLGSVHVLGDLSALAFAVSLFVVVCAAEAQE